MAYAAPVMHLLIVEDDDRLRRLLKRLLEEQRHVVDTCSTGEDGYAVASAPGDAIDVVVLDIGLPDVSGLEVAQTASAGQEPGGHPDAHRT